MKQRRQNHTKPHTNHVPRDEDNVTRGSVTLKETLETLIPVTALAHCTTVSGRSSARNRVFVTPVCDVCLSRGSRTFETVSVLRGQCAA